VKIQEKYLVLQTRKDKYPDADSQFANYLNFNWNSDHECLNLNYNWHDNANPFWGSASGFLPLYLALASKN
jgi:hypothetical protein